MYVIVNTLLAATKSFWEHTGRLVVHIIRLQHILTMPKGKKKHLKTERETWLSPKRGAGAGRNFTALMISIFCKDSSRKNVKHLSYLHRSMTRDSPSVMSPFWLQ